MVHANDLFASRANTRPSHNTRPFRRLTAVLALSALTLGACGGEAPTDGIPEEATTSSTGAASTTTTVSEAFRLAVGMVGGCSQPFTVYAQHRWPPDGAALRKAPDLNAEQIDGFPGNTPIEVDGYVHASAPYGHNIPPFNNDVWLHRRRGGWVTYAAVRATVLDDKDFDPTGSPPGGPPVILPLGCEGKVAS